MPYYLLHAGTTIQKMSTAGALADVSLPLGVTVSASRPARFALLNKIMLVANAPSRTLLFDGGLNTHLASLSAPTLAPSVGSTSGTLIGAYACAYTFAIKDIEGKVLCESGLSPLSVSITLATAGIAISALQVSSASGVTTRRIYRTASGGDTLYWAQDIENNTQTTTTSAEQDVALGSVSVALYGLGEAPGATADDRLTLVVAWKDRLWGVSDTEPDNLRYSGARMPYAWSGFNMIPVPPIGEDTTGVNGFLARRDELGVLKLGRLCKIVGSSPDDFQLIVVAEGVGCYAPDSCLVVRDVGYFMGHDGVYAWGPEGLTSISDAQVRPWFTTGRYFNRDAWSSAFARYNWRTHSVELHLPSAGQTDLDLWVQYDIERKRWFGPHTSAAMMPTCGGQITDDAGLPVPAVGCDMGYLWTQDNPAVMDGDYAIDFDTLTQPYVENLPDEQKLFKELSLINAVPQIIGGFSTFVSGFSTFVDFPVATGFSTFVSVTPTVDKDTQASMLAPLSQTRSRLRRVGAGRLLSIRFQNDDPGSDCEIYGFEVPFHVLGRR